LSHPEYTVPNGQDFLFSSITVWKEYIVVSGYSSLTDKSTVCVVTKKKKLGGILEIDEQGRRFT